MAPCLCVYANANYVASCGHGSMNENKRDWPCILCCARLWVFFLVLCLSLLCVPPTLRRDKRHLSVWVCFVCAEALAEARRAAKWAVWESRALVGQTMLEQSVVCGPKEEVRVP